MPKPRTAAGYDRAHVMKVRETCLYLATKLGDILDELVIVGGLVPSLIIDQTSDSIERACSRTLLGHGPGVAAFCKRI